MMMEDLDKVLYTKKELAACVERLGKQISKDYAGEEIFAVCILKSDGGTMKRYLTEDVMKWEQECSNLELEQKAI